MKFAITLMLALLVCVPAFGQDNVDLKGKMLAGGYAGYTLGMGDPFGDHDGSLMGVSYSSSFKPGISFGGTFHYGVTPKLMVGGEIGFQSYKFESGDVTYGGVSYPTGSDASSTETNILGSCLYALNYADDGAMFINFGAGIYGGDSEIGIFGGIVYQKKLSESMNWFIMPRFHYVMTDTAMKMIQIAAGVNFPLGGK